MKLVSTTINGVCYLFIDIAYLNDH